MAKGTVWLMGAQVAFLVSGYIIHFGLGGYLLSAAEYGTFGVILALLAIVRIFVQGGVPQAVSKYVAEGRDQTSIERNALMIQSIVMLVCFTIVFAFSPYISSLLGDEALTPYIRLMALIIPFSGVFQIYFGIINGRRWFGRQAIIMGIYAILRPVMVFLLVLSGFAISGAIGGFIIAMAGVLILSSYIAKKQDSPKARESIDVNEMFWFFMPLMILAVGITSIRSIDMLLVKSLLRDNNLVGYYTSAWAISALPLTVFAALSFTILPSISSSLAKKDMNLTQSYIKNSVRYSLMILLPIALLIAANPGGLLTLLYRRAEYAAGGEALGILIIGMIFLMFFTLFNTTIIAMGRPKIPMFIVIGLLPMDIVLNYILIPIYGLKGAALATTLISLIGMFIAGLYIYRKIGNIVDVFSITKIVFSSMIIFGVALILPLQGLLLIVISALLFCGYGGILWLLREIKEDDVDLIKGLF